MKNHCYAVILAGGSGTRLWPLSRSGMPKHLLAFDGEATLLQQTAQRLLKGVSPPNITTITHCEQQSEVKWQLNKIHPDLARNVLAEPRQKNTLPAIACAVAGIHKHDPDACVGVFPADHLIQAEDQWLQAFQQALRCAPTTDVVLFGVKPDFPATEYGYIEMGRQQDRSTEVLHFKEKPDLPLAQKYLEAGNYLWNSGMFVFAAKNWLKALKEHQPRIHQLATQIADLGTEIAAEIYEEFPSLSIDTGLIEKMKHRRVLPVDLGWTDLGSWEAMYRLRKRNNQDNVEIGNVVSLGCQHNLLWSQERLLATLGIEDLIVVQTADATLVSRRDRVGDLKELVQTIAKNQPALVQSPRTFNRPWGSFTVLEEQEGYKVKKIVVNPGEKLSLQKHHKRCEYWMLVSGRAQVTCGEKKFLLDKNKSTFIPKEGLHQLENIGKKPLQVIEVQIGDDLGEDDIERHEDEYGRL